MATRTYLLWSVRLHRLMSCVAALVVFYVEWTGSDAVKANLLGATHPTHHASTYHSPLIGKWVASLLNSSSPWIPPPTGWLYLDESPDGSVVTSPDTCTTVLPGDRIYAPRYLNVLLPRIASAAPSLSALLSSTILVDCAYTGRVVQDTTALKLHFVDAAATQLTTLFLQTVHINRPTKRLSSACGLATFSTVDLSAVTLPDLLTPQEASYMHTIGLDFPYDLPAFYVLTVPHPHDRTVEGMWAGTLAPTNEPVSVAGTDGIFRSSIDTQAGFGYVTWDFPTNPIEFMTVIQYLTTDVSKDAFGWVRLLLGMGITLTLAVNGGVALLVALRMHSVHGASWVPDVFPCVQFRIQLRALLCLLVLASTNGWHLFEYALCTANARQGWTNTFVLTDIVRADALMVYLGLTITLAKIVRIRLRLDIVVLIYLVCYQFSDVIVASHGLALEATNAYVKANYLANILEAHVDGMDLWAWHENHETNLTLLLTQMTWWLLACLVVALYAVFEKTRNMYDRKTRSMRTWRRMHHLTMLCLDNSTKNRGGRRISDQYCARIVPSTLVASKLLSRRSYTGDDVCRAGFEPRVRQKLCETYGLIAPLDEYHLIGNTHFVSPSSVWLLGYVLLDDRFILDIHDYPLAVCNAICGRQIFLVYAFPYKHSTVAMDKVLLAPEAVPFASIGHLALYRLR